MKKNIIYTITAIITLIAIIIVLSSGAGLAKLDNIKSFDGEITLYKSQSCGCCTLWQSYFKSQGNSKIKDITFQDQEELDNKKNELGIPLDLQTCHTLVIGKYFVEGHVPLEVIEKLLLEQPDIKGIALPGMPEGSPGMPGKKRGDFVIFQINNDGSYEEYIRY